jgi:hypothetical protein
MEIKVNRFAEIENTDVARLPRPLSIIISDVKNKQHNMSDANDHDYYSDQPSHEHHRDVAPVRGIVNRKRS